MHTNVFERMQNAAHRIVTVARSGHFGGFENTLRDMVVLGETTPAGAREFIEETLSVLQTVGEICPRMGQSLVGQLYLVAREKNQLPFLVTKGLQAVDTMHDAAPLTTAVFLKSLLAATEHQPDKQPDIVKKAINLFQTLEARPPRHLNFKPRGDMSNLITDLITLPGLDPALQSAVAARAVAAAFAQEEADTTVICRGQSVALIRAMGEAMGANLSHGFVCSDFMLSDQMTRGNHHPGKAHDGPQAVFVFGATPDQTRARLGGQGRSLSDCIQNGPPPLRQLANTLMSVLSEYTKHKDQRAPLPLFGEAMRNCKEFSGRYNPSRALTKTFSRHP